MNALKLIHAHRDQSVVASRCATCDKHLDLATEFTDVLSRKEYAISGMCQACQNAVFNSLDDSPEPPTLDLETTTDLW